MPLPFRKKEKSKGKYSLLNDPDISDSGTEEEAIVFEKKLGHVELNLIPRQPRVRVVKKPDRLKCICLFLAVAVIIGSVILLAVYFGTQYKASKSDLKNNSSYIPLSNTSVINNISNIYQPNTDQEIPNIPKTERLNTGSENTEIENTRPKNTGTKNWKITYKHSGGEGGLRLIDVDRDGLDDIVFGTAGSDLIADVLDVAGNKFDDLHRYCQLKGGEGGLRLIDVDLDGLDDIVFGTAPKDIIVVGTKFDGLHRYCYQKGLEYPCVGSLVALRGYDGVELWRFNTRSEVFLTVCDVDLNKDGLPDCIGTGRQSVCVAFDPRKGEVLWTAEDDNFIAANWNIYQALALQDWDNDGVKDILIVNGGDPLKDPEDHDRSAGRGIMLSGATGKPLGNRYLELPDSKESYMSPSLYPPPDGSSPYVLFGSGGETVPGDLLAITEEDLCVYIMGNQHSDCPHYDQEPFWGHKEKVQNGLIKIYSGKVKGVMVPPVIVDVNKDVAPDLVLSAYDGVVVLLDGKSLQPLWTSEFPGMESYSSPAPGYFDDDDTIDFMLHWCEGAWDKYTGSNATVISGKDGRVIWTLGSSFMQMSSGLSLKTNQPNQDMFLFRVKGRDSIFRRDKDGHIIRQNGLLRNKRHGGDSLKDIDENQYIEDLMNANYSLSDAVQKAFREKHLTCLDDLTTYRGEVLLMDGTISNNPFVVLELPAEKYYYDIPNDNDDEERDKLLKQLYPEKFEDRPVYNANTHMSGMMSGEEHGGGDLLPQDSTGTDNIGSRKRRHLGESDDSPETSPDKLCTVAYYDARTTGAVSDVDDDGFLDYISVLALMVPLYDEHLSYHSLDYQTLIHKVSLETGIMEGSLKSVSVKATTHIKDSGISTKFDRASRIFKPMDEQTWTAFMGKTGSSVYSDKNVP